MGTLLVVLLETLEACFNGGVFKIALVVSGANS